MALQIFSPSTSSADVAAATLKDGAAIVSGLVATSLVGAVSGELRENLENFGYRSKREFSGFRTNRSNSTFKDAPSSVALIGHDMV
jgi:hypothetical protein